MIDWFIDWTKINFVTVKNLNFFTFPFLLKSFSSISNESHMARYGPLTSSSKNSSPHSCYSDIFLLLPFIFNTSTFYFLWQIEWSFPLFVQFFFFIFFPFQEVIFHTSSGTWFLTMSNQLADVTQLFMKNNFLCKYSKSFWFQLIIFVVVYCSFI